MLGQLSLARFPAPVLSPLSVDPVSKPSMFDQMRLREHAAPFAVGQRQHERPRGNARAFGPALELYW